MMRQKFIGGTYNIQLYNMECCLHMEFGLCQLLLFNYFYVVNGFLLQKFEIDPLQNISNKFEPISSFLVGVHLA